MSAETIAKALRGTRQGGRWMARCPCHDDRTPSLSIKDSGDSKVLVHCFADCTQEAVIEALRARGLWPERQRWQGRPNPSSAAANVDRNDGGTKSKRDFALRIWAEAKPAADSLVEQYLRSRKIETSPPNSIRSHPALKHVPTKHRWPAMVALVTRGTDGEPLGIHRTYLERDGSGKAPVEPARMMLGPCRSGAVRLGEPVDRLMVGEGIETCLAAMQATGRPAWAALSTSGLRALDLPDAVQDVTLLADGDERGEMAAQHAASHWKREGRRVRIARPPRGLDFNDVLLGRVTRFTDSAT